MSNDNHFLHLNDYTLVNLSYLMRLADQIVRDRDGLFPITRTINCSAFYTPILKALNKLDEKHQWSYVGLTNGPLKDNGVIFRGLLLAQLLSDDTHKVFESTNNDVSDGDDE